MPVSYTHLDVYKRQLHNKERSSTDHLIEFGEAECFTGDWKVKVTSGLFTFFSGISRQDNGRIIAQSYIRKGCACLIAYDRFVKIVIWIICLFVVRVSLLIHHL